MSKEPEAGGREIMEREIIGREIMEREIMEREIMEREIMEREIMEAKLLWNPDSKNNTHMDRFRAQVTRDYGLNLVNYNELYQWSVENYADFWAEVWKFCGISCSQMYEEVVDVSKRISDVPEWFRGSRLNYTENLLKHTDQEKVALYAAAEGREEIMKVTFGELRREVARFAASMRKMGIKAGDRVVGYLPNCVHAVEVMLAAASIGAIWSSTSPDFGVNGVLDRFSQIQPKLIFSVAAVVYNGKQHDHMDKLQRVVKGLPDLKKVVVIPYVRSKGEIDLSKIPNSVFLEEFLAMGMEGDQDPQLEFEQLPFSHPLFIMYSSGTTGAPKCMVHSAGGTLIQHLKEHILHGNMTSNDVIIYYTTTGWMMWNWLVSSLAVGASVVLYDGSPLVPTPDVLWNLVDQLGITIFGTGAKWLSVLEERNLKPADTHSLQSLHTILSTGSPLKPQSYEYVYNCIKHNVLLGSISGGTDIISCFMGQNLTVPVYKGEIQARNLGMAVEAWSPEGKAVWGESGELVCLKPIPCQPTHFWNDDNGNKYRKAYFSTFQGVWAHGDYCKINPKTGGIVMLGRSDGTLNPNGVRFGSSEIYNIVEAFEEVCDSVCVPQYNSDGEERVILFLKLVQNETFSAELVAKIRSAIRASLSARHVPTIILQTKDIPYTISGKKVEVAVKQVIAGKEVSQRGAFSNPESLDLYKNIPELQNF
ncbi:acetoacetyl-CoA synthetase isoform X2 [Neoarius graeffei]|uniref:acetoacetyl-CoA synthetase isoform X2 n=1 Tax=Neoarius graeffei TaxID=443677 RepID=UPI00298BDEF0|nr:acetoacetyl-CoA synthetase isoform X2 [Neoarius graeffei]